MVAQRVVRGWLARRRVAGLREEKRHRDAVKIQTGECTSHIVLGS